jgi:hypothetical protein
MTYYTTAASPIGELLLVSNGQALTALHMAPFEVSPEWHRDESRFEDVVAQLMAYFAGARETFDVVRRADLPALAASGLTGYFLYQMGFVLGLERWSRASVWKSPGSRRAPGYPRRPAGSREAEG